MIHKIPEAGDVYIGGVNIHFFITDTQYVHCTIDNADSYGVYNSIKQFNEHSANWEDWKFVLNIGKTWQLLNEKEPNPMPDLQRIKSILVKEDD